MAAARATPAATTIDPAPGTEAALLPDLRITERVVIAGGELDVAFARSGGPGGQNVNKVASKAVLRWTPATSPSLPPAVRDRLVRAVAPRLTTEGELLITSQRTRDQGRNIQDCLDKLRELVLDACRPPKVRRPTKPTAGSRERRVESKARRSAVKELRRKPDHD